MKKISDQGRRIRGLRYSVRLIYFIMAGCAAAGLMGCSWWKNYTSPPIIDASQHPVGYNSQTPAPYNDPRYARPAESQPDRYARTAAYNRPAPVQQGYSGSYPVAAGSAEQPPQSYPPVADNFPAENRSFSAPSVPGQTNGPSRPEQDAYRLPMSSSPTYDRQPAGSPMVTDVRIRETDRKTDVAPLPDKTGDLQPASQTQLPRATITGLAPGDSRTSPAAIQPRRDNPSAGTSLRLTDMGEPLLASAGAMPQPAIKMLANPTPESIQPPQPTVSQQPVTAPPEGVVQPATAVSPITAVPPPAVSTSPAAASDNAVDIQTIQLQLEKYLRRQPKDTNVQLALRYLYQAQGLTDKAAEPLKDIPVEQQAEALQLARTFLLAQQASAKANRDNPALICEALQSLSQLENRLAENADLEIANLNICQEAARGFGQYQPMNKDDLESGKNKTIWIYFELRNFQTRLDDQGKYTSRIGAEITLYDDQFRMVKQLLQSEVPDESFNRRKDFYLHAGPLKMPDLPPGKYQLVVSAEDKIAKKAARPARFDFEIQPEKQK